MPFHGVTDTDYGKPPKIGRLNKGDEKRPNLPGENLEGFRFTPFPATDKDLLDRFMKHYGGEWKQRSVKGKMTDYQDWPQSIPVYLIEEDPRIGFPHGYYEWVKGGPLHICDGETMSRVYDPSIRRMRLVEEPCPYFSGAKKRNPPAQPGCLAQGTLDLYLPMLGRRGYVEWVTKSWNDCVNIFNALMDAYSFVYRELRPAAQALGIEYDFRMVNTPFILSRKLTEITKTLPDGKRIRGPEWLAYIEMNDDWYRQAKARIVEDARDTVFLPWSTGHLLQKPKEVLPQPEIIEYEEAEIIEHVQTA